MAVGVQKAWSTTASSNGAADTNIGFAEGQTPASVNDGARAVMAALKGFSNQILGAKTTGGSANAYTFTSDSVAAISTAYAAGMGFVFKANHTNTGASTFNADSVGATAIRKGGAETALSANDIVANGIYFVVYNGTYWILLNPETGVTSAGYQPLDAQLTALAGISPVSGDIFYWTGATSLSALATTASALTALTTMTAAGLALVDDADASAQRTTLGLVIGTNVQAYDAGLAYLDGLDFTNEATFKAGVNLEIGVDVLAYDADVFYKDVGGTVSAATTFTADNTHTAAQVNVWWIETGGTANEGKWLWRVDSDILRLFAMRDDLGDSDTAIEITRSGKNVETMSIGGAAGVVSIAAFAGRTALSSETSGTLTSASSNKRVKATGGVTINDGVHTAEDAIEIYNDSDSSITLTQDTGMTLRLAGTTTTGNRTLAARAIAYVYFDTNADAAVGGSGVS